MKISCKGFTCDVIYSDVMLTCVTAFIQNGFTACDTLRLIKTAR